MIKQRPQRTTKDLYKHLVFGSGQISIFKTNEILVPTNTLVVFTESFRNAGIRVEQLMYAIGKSEGLFLFRTFWQQAPKQKMECLDMLLDFLEYAGLGHFEAVRLSLESANFTFWCTVSPLARQHLKLGFAQQSTDFYATGILAGFLSALSGRELAGREAHCICKGYAQCVIELSPGEKVAEEGEIEALIENKEFFYQNALRPSYNNIIEKSLSQNHLVLVDGEVKLWNFSTTFIPIATLLLYERYIKMKLGPDAARMFYYIGQKQAHAASWIQIKQYGRKNDKKLYLSMFEQHDLIGCGKGELLEFDEEKRRVKLGSFCNTYLRYFSALFGHTEPANNYLAGLTSGITMAYFNRDIQSDETDVREDSCTFTLYEESRPFPPLIEELAKNSLTVRGFLK